jgi:hypothetical protein
LLSEFLGNKLLYFGASSSVSQHGMMFRPHLLNYPANWSTLECNEMTAMDTVKLQAIKVVCTDALEQGSQMATKEKVRHMYMYIF